MDRDFHHDHDELRTIMRRFAAAMEGGFVTTRAALLRDRVAFSQLFRSHMVAEDAHLRTMPIDEALRARAIAEFQQLFADYSTHVRAWTPQRIEREWDDYRAAVRALQARLTARMAWEERAFLPCQQHAV